MTENPNSLKADHTDPPIIRICRLDPTQACPQDLKIVVRPTGVEGNYQAKAILLTNPPCGSGTLIVNGFQKEYPTPCSRALESLVELSKNHPATTHITSPNIYTLNLVGPDGEVLESVQNGIATTTKASPRQSLPPLTDPN